MPSIEIFIVTFKRDATWCMYNLRSIRKFCRGFSGTTVLVPLEDAPEFEPMCREFGARLFTFHQHPTKGMLHHEAMICRADEFCEADLILHTDADCHFIEPVAPEDYLVDGKPILLRQLFSQLKEHDNPRHRWKEAVENALGFEAEYETMCRHPAVHYRWLYPEVRAAVERHTRMAFDEYVLAQKNEYPQTFAEFPTLGAYASKFHEDKYFWVEHDWTTPVDRTTPPTNPPFIPADKLAQEWSHDGVTPEAKEKLDRLLS
jgi:hypothetical protein